MVKRRVVSICEIQRRTGLSLAHVSKIYGGTRNPSIPAARLLAAAQGMSLEEVLDSIKVEAAEKRKRKADEERRKKKGQRRRAAA